MPEQIDRFALPGSGSPQAVFALSQAYPILATLKAYRNGELLYPTQDYTVSGTSVTLLVTAHSDLIQFIYGYNATGATTPGTAQSYIYMALRNCGQIRPGYTPSPELLADGLQQFQMIFDRYNAERTMQFTMPDYVFPIAGPGHGTTGNNQSFGGTGYQIGPTALDFVANRPESIVRMNLYMTSASPSSPTRIPMDQISMEQWMNIVTIQLTPINVATVFAYDPQYPNGVIWIWPPLNGNSLEIFTWGFLTPPSTLDAQMSLPPAYQDAIIWHLTQRLWPLCTQDIMPHKLPLQFINGQKAKALADVRRINAPMPKLVSDFRGGSNRNTGVCDWGLLLAGVPY